MSPNDPHPLILSIGTQVVSQKDLLSPNGRIAHPAGAVGVIVRSPNDLTHAYRVKFNDGYESAVAYDQLIRLADYKNQHGRGLASSLMSEGLSLSSGMSTRLLRA